MNVMGLWRGTVVSNVDPLNSGRLQVIVPAVTGMRQAPWAVPSVPKGFPVITPEPGDPVWVMFESGDINSPVWTGIPTSSGGELGGDALRLDALTVGTLSVTGTSSFGGDIALTGTLTSGTVPWARLSGAPVYTTRWADWVEVTNKPETATRWPAWSEVTGKPNVALTDAAQTFTLTQTFAVAPSVPDASFSVSKLSATGTRDATVYLRGDGTWSVVDLASRVAKTGDTMTGALRIDKFVPLTGTTGALTDRALQIGERSALVVLGETTADQRRGIEMWQNLYYDGSAFRTVVAGGVPTRFAAGDLNGLIYQTFDVPTAAGAVATGSVNRFAVNNTRAALGPFESPGWTVPSGWDSAIFRPTTHWGDGIPAGTAPGPDVTGGTKYGTLGADRNGIMLKAPHVVWNPADNAAELRMGRSGGVSTGDWWGIGTGTSNVFRLFRGGDSPTMTWNPNRKIEVHGNGYTIYGPNSTWGAYVQIGGNDGRPTSNTALIQTTNGNLHIDAALGFNVYLNWYGGASAGGTLFGNGQGGQVGSMGRDGTFAANGQVNSNSYIHAHRGSGDYEVRIGEIYGLGGLYHPTGHTLFSNGQDGGWYFHKNGNTRVFTIDAGGTMYAVGNANKLSSDSQRWVPLALVGDGNLTAVASTNGYNMRHYDGADLNRHWGAGRYNLVNTANSPWSTTNDGRWSYLEVLCHSGGSHWQKQTIHDMTGGDSVWERDCNGGDPTVASSWTGWRYISG